MQFRSVRAVPIPGITGRIHNPDNDSLPTPVARMFIKHVVDYQPSPTEQHLIHQQQSQQPATPGPGNRIDLGHIPDNIDVTITITGQSCRRSPYPSR